MNRVLCRIALRSTNSDSKSSMPAQDSSGKAGVVPERSAVPAVFINFDDAEVCKKSFVEAMLI